MKQLSYVALSALLSFGCGGSSATVADGGPRPDSAASLPEVDGREPVDVPGKQDDVPIVDTGASDTAPADAHAGDEPKLDVAASDTAPADAHAGDEPKLDVAASDTPATIDAPTPIIDASVDSQTLTLKDGRTLTVVDFCYLGPLRDDTACPKTYAEAAAAARARVQATADGGFAQTHTGAGRCSEGAYVYAPVMDTSGEGCYYDATTQKLVGDEQYSDMYAECANTDTVAFAFLEGTTPRCSTITWEIYGSASYPR